MESYGDKFIEFDRYVLTAILTAVSETPQKHAHELLSQFPSFQHAMRADQKTLTKIIGQKGAMLLRTIPDAVASMTRETALKAASYILSIEAAKTHFSALLNGRRNEALAVIYLNTKNRLIDEDIWEGSIDRTAFYPREIIRQAAILDASAILMAHNHPSGDTFPSSTDFRLTLKLQDILLAIDVILIDHLVYGEGEPYSMRENGDI